ncbi:MAG: hypothetical protein DHS20C18_54720 [Saprospiraceae bacterium]|nr:MAG: hypothetical protein DHS20C18_54720 [Saprospiraceae bacterium]
MKKLGQKGVQYIIVGLISLIISLAILAPKPEDSFYVFILILSVVIHLFIILTGIHFLYKSRKGR